MPKTHTFLFMGAPGSGKGTQAALLAERLGGRVFTSGDEFRALAASQVYVGRRLRESLEAGELMPAWFASFVFEKTLLALEPQETIIFGGSVRTKDEAELFHEVVHWLGRPYIAIYLEASEAVVAQRLQAQAGKEGRRDDDQSVFHKRMEEFNAKTLPAVDFFRTCGTLSIVNGDEPIETVQKNIHRILGL